MANIGILSVPAPNSGTRTSKERTLNFVGAIVAAWYMVRVLREDDR